MPDSRLSPDQKWQLFLDSAQDYAFITTDPDSRITEWSAGAGKMFRCTEQEILGSPIAILFVPEDRARGEPEREVKTALSNGRAEDERWHLRRDGTRFQASGVLTPIRDDTRQLIGFAKVMRDVTERELAHQRQNELLRQRTALLSEIHHRVKNNLQVIVSLMSLQSDHITDPALLSMYEDTQNRIRAIARIHERSYSTEDLAIVHFGEYLFTVANDLHNFYGTGDRVRIETNLADLAIDMDTAVPLGLISNELICNALKHGFPEGRKGVVTVTLDYGEAERGRSRAILSVSDSGVGLPEGTDLASAGNMGFHLVQILSQQIRAELTVESSNGTVVRLSFSLGAE